MPWEGLRRSVFEEDARRLCYRWVALLTRYYSLYECVPEKLDVVNDETTWNTGSDVEYGTQCNSRGEYFGWTCASVAVAHAKGFLGEYDIISLNLDTNSSVETQLDILTAAKMHTCESISSCTWSTMASNGNQRSVCAEALFSYTL